MSYTDRNRIIEMPRLLHNLFCRVSRKYRATHVRHVDELPPRMQRKLREECREMDPRSWDTAESFMRDLEEECASEDQHAEKISIRRGDI